MTEPDTEPWLELHAIAEQEGRDTYLDPRTGYTVFTASYHRRRGGCCGSGCRHCPFGHESVRKPAQTMRSWAPTLFQTPLSNRGSENVDVVFWSGGKDSWLAWDLVRQTGRETVWLTTYRPSTLEVPLQAIPIDSIIQQAERAHQTLLIVPVERAIPYGDSVIDGLDILVRLYPIGRIVFGDLWLEDLRAHRETMLAPWLETHGAQLHFPLWKQPPEQLLKRLFAADIEVSISASQVDGVSPGTPFDRSLLARLPTGIDPMGERGEFHTRVVW